MLQSLYSDPAALNPGREYPRWMYHATKKPVMVSSAGEERNRGPEWSRRYIHQEYPKVKYHWNGKTSTVNNADEEPALGGGWANRPDEFEKYKDARRIRTERHDPAKWLEEWPVPGLAPEHRNRIKAQLLKADGTFERSLDTNPENGAVVSMRQAFDGVASVLFDAGILTEDLLCEDIPSLVWDAAVGGGWWFPASETKQNIFPERLGHYWVWRDGSRDWTALFRAETVEWEAKLLESPPRAKAAHVSPKGQPEIPNEGKLPSILSAKTCRFATASERIDAVTAYTATWKCSQATLARTAWVNPADLSKWRKGLLPAESSKKERIERALTNNEAPRSSAKDRRES